MHRIPAVVLLAILLLLPLAGCGGGGGTSGTPETTPFLPLAVGNSWKYNYTIFSDAASKNHRPSALLRRHPRLNAKAATYVDNVSVTGTQRISGTQWYEVTYRYEGGKEDLSYVRHTDAGLQSWDGALGQAFFDIKLPTQVGTTWTKRWLDENDVPQTSQMTITSLTAEVATPAGVFTNCVQVEDVWLEATVPDTITRWYAPGVGQVREERHVDNAAAPEHLLELSEYTIPVSQ